MVFFIKTMKLKASGLDLSGGELTKARMGDVMLDLEKANQSQARLALRLPCQNRKPIVEALIPPLKT